MACKFFDLLAFRIVRDADVECVTQLVVHARITPLLGRRFFEEYIKKKCYVQDGCSVDVR